MIQRIQSIYLLAACILCVATMSTGIAHFHTLQGEPVVDMYNLWFTMADGQHDLRPWSLFVLLLIVSTLSFLDILLFRRRALQMRVASFCMILLVGWYVVYGFFVWEAVESFHANFRPTVAAALPFAALVAQWLAFRGILHDERLVRSSYDRLR